MIKSPKLSVFVYERYCLQILLYRASDNWLENLMLVVRFVCIFWCLVGRNQLRVVVRGGQPGFIIIIIIILRIIIIISQSSDCSL